MAVAPAKPRPASQRVVVRQAGRRSGPPVPVHEDPDPRLRDEVPHECGCGAVLGDEPVRIIIQAARHRGLTQRE